MKRRAEDPLFCQLCNFSTNFSSLFQRHLNTEKHLRNCRIVAFETRQNFTDRSCSDAKPDSGDTEFSSIQPTTNANSDNVEVMINDQESSTSSNDDDSDDDDDVVTNSPNDQPIWFPFSSKLQMYLYILVHSKTHTISDETAKFIWFIMKESGIEMPSFSSVKNLRISGDMTPESMLSREESSDGNPFLIIKPTALLSMTLSHPDTATSLLRYGRVSSDGQVLLKEQSDGSKWVHEIRSHYASNGKNTFFSGDFVSSSNHDSQDIGQIFTFLQDIQNDIIYAKVKIFRANACPGLAGKSLVYLETSEMWNICHLSQVQKVHEYTFYKSFNGEVIRIADDEKNTIVYQNPHKVRGLPVYTVPLNLFMDDTSANKSKKWKPLHCVQLQLAGIPKARKQNPDTIKFVSASTEVPILEMASSVIDDIKNSEGGILTFDAQRREKVTIIPCITVCVCDFNMLAEASNHMGANTNKFCPRCYADKDSSIWKGDERHPAKTQRILGHLSMNNNKEMRQNHGLKPYSNPLWNILNPHRDIPVGILHWLFLGIGKHLLKACIQDLPEIKQEQLCMLIESCDQSAFGTKVSSDTIKYIDSRQGKDIKTYLQIAPFHFAIVGLDRNKIGLLCQLAEISKLLTCTKEFSETSLESLQNQTDTYLQGLRNHVPQLQQKVKTHLSVHIHVVDDIFTHGPMDCYKEDAFEKMHGRIRDQLFKQNLHARSRDTASAFAEMEILNHVITGGYFPNGEEWLQASGSVQSTAACKEVRQFLALPDESTSTTIKLRKAMERQNGSLVWEFIDDETVHMLSLIFNDIDFTGAKRSKFYSIKTQSEQLVNKGASILHRVDDNKEEVGLFDEGWLISTAEGMHFHLAKIFRVTPLNNSRLNDIALERVAITQDSVVVPVSRILSIICLVHDCLSEGCRVKDGLVSVHVEQEMKDVRKKFWKHKKNVVYFFKQIQFCQSQM